MRKFSFLTGLTLVAAAYGLSACSSLQTDAVFPPGYAYNHDEFKSADGEPAHDIGYTYTPNINDKSLEILNHIMVDLTDQMEQDFNLHKQDIHLVPHAQKSLFLNSYEYALERELIRRGYTLHSAAGKMPYLYYESKLADQQDSKLYKNIRFTLTLVIDHKIIKQTSLVETVPAFYQDVSTSRHYLGGLYKLEINDQPEPPAEYPKAERTAAPNAAASMPSALVLPAQAPAPQNAPNAPEATYPYYPPKPGSGPYPPSDYKP